METILYLTKYQAMKTYQVVNQVPRHGDVLYLTKHNAMKM